MRGCQTCSNWILLGLNAGLLFGAALLAIRSRSFGTMRFGLFLTRFAKECELLTRLRVNTLVACGALAAVLSGLLDGVVKAQAPTPPANIPTTLPIPIDSYVTQFSSLFAVSFAAIVGLGFIWAIVKMVRRKALATMARSS